MATSPEQMRAWKANNHHRMLTGQATPPHGEARTYTDYLCRCDPCTAANSARCKEWTERNPEQIKAARLAFGRKVRRSVTPDPQRAGLQWTGADMSLATERDSTGAYVRTAQEAARLLGRSVSAVQQIRSKCLRDPRYIYAAGEPA